ncbi:MAG: PfkB family carbohydrate kinase [Pleomorphochaeta sp.]
MIKFRENAKYDLICPSSMGIRLVPKNRQPVSTSTEFEMQSTSAETNVLNISSSLNLRVKVLTSFVKDNAIASFIKNQLRMRNIEFEGPDISSDGPWGYRHQINIADSGFGLRAPKVTNDRAGEIGRELKIENYDLEKLFVEDGVKLLHLSGLVAALSENTTKFCLELVRKAKENGTLISFDLNYRESFWCKREKELREAFIEIAKLSDFLIGNEEDFQLALGIKGPEIKDSNLSDNINQFKEMINRVKIEYPKVKVFATTLRQVENANEHYWGAIMNIEDNWYFEEPRKIQILDRIGGGDGFVGGILYSALKNFNYEDWIKFGWATGALATTMVSDYATVESEDQVWSIYDGNARIKR